MPPPPRNLKRKKAPYAESSSGEDTPLASSPAKHAASAAVAMPGAVQATTIPASSVNGKGKPRKSVGNVEASDADDDSDDEAPKKKRPVNGKGKMRPPKKKPKTEESGSAFGSDDEDDKPIVTKKPRKRKANVEPDAGVLSGDEQPAPKKAAVKKPRAKKAKKVEDASGSDTPKDKKKTGKAKKEIEVKGSPTKGKGKKKEEQEPEEVFRWWEADPNGDGSVKWQTLEHNGVIFPPPYEPLPSHVKMKYNGTSYLLMHPALFVNTPFSQENL